jgi:peptide/nickel transport system permease protein
VSAGDVTGSRPAPRAGLTARLTRNRMIMIGGAILLALVLVAILAPLLSPYGPNDMDVRQRLRPPSAGHLLGTDNFGRDLLTRIAYGAQVSLWIGFTVALASAAIGMVVGLYSAYFPRLDNLLMRICDALMAFPSILLAISIMAALGPQTVNVVIALVIVFAPSLARTVRSAALVVKEQTYIEAMRALGASPTRIIWQHIAPNTLSPLITQGTFIFAEAIIIEAALSFLGVGVPPPDPSWGSILHDGKVVIFSAWWMTVAPGVVIILAVLGLNLFGDGLRDLLDPHTAKGGGR